ncbi:hypothetical protein SSX86_015789 [Deinandra increscens subsp. villosa]|uniref:B box-type domain-containing protein n=1 Tax=Deinandra increscens subsp. villosa TaxID=3103831 RepID=A0AAP0GXT4_9ASTR
MKPCALCKSAAKVYCDSDQASLCWTCDSKVHSANFLVARHSRSLLCRVCRSPTPWTASGEKIGPAAFSICEKCVVDGTSDGEESEGENHDDEDDDEYDGDEDDETELDVDDEDDGDDDIQVVPLSFTPPPAASSSSDDDSVGDRSGLSKRKRENVSDLSEVLETVTNLLPENQMSSTAYRWMILVRQLTDARLARNGRKTVTGIRSPARRSLERLPADVTEQVPSD